LVEHYQRIRFLRLRFRYVLNNTRPDAAAGVDEVPPRVLRLPELNHIITRLLNLNSPIGVDLS
jgi:hypothetical protein